MLGLLVFPINARPTTGGVCSVPLCPTAQYEYCDATKGQVQFTNCLTRNRREDNRYHQCFRQRLHDCERERQEEQRQRAQSPKPRPLGACTAPMCPIAQYEQCDTKADDFQACLARNRQEDARFAECMNGRRQTCKEEAK
jgi:hypothetical protein